MHDVRFEDLVRQTLRAEAANLTLTVTSDLLERRLVERRRQAQTTRRLGMVAAVAALAVIGGAVVLSQRQADLPPVATSPSPSASPSPAVVLPDTSDLLSGYPTATIRLERSEGPATGRAAPLASANPGASPEPVVVGRIRFG
ncbi:MAG: hypothetical protein WEC14_02260, partial [Chloroflexota bacterium]